MWAGLYLIAIMVHCFGFCAFKHFTIDNFFGFLGYGMHAIGFISIYLITIAYGINLIINN